MLNSLHEVLHQRSLSRPASEQAMESLLQGFSDHSIPSEQVVAFLVALRIKGESDEEIAGFLDCLKKKAIPFSSKNVDLLDVCGTGGDSLGTFNISTTVTFVAAAAGQPIAKHGNRKVSSQAGSFDVLESLGLPFEESPEKISQSISEFGIGLFYSPAFYPCLKAIAPVRKKLGIRTVFNLLGPLLNPACVKRQLVGVFDESLLEAFARILLIHGSEEAMIVRGKDGLDEISLSGPTKIAHLKNGKIRSYELTPEDFGLPRAPIEALKGGDSVENTRILLGILEGNKGACRNIVLLNTSAALVVGGKAHDFKEGVEKAREAIDSGRALALLHRMRAQL